MKKELERLVEGFRRFRKSYFEEGADPYHIAQGQGPKTLVIACSDSRVDPAIITSSHLGELFTIRNIANLVPPYETTSGFHGVSSAIEFAVVNLQVENIVVMGHRQCGGIRALMLGPESAGRFVRQWMRIAEDAKKRVLKQHAGANEDVLCRHGEMESILSSLTNLRTFPFVAEAIDKRGLKLYGAYFDLEKGELYYYDDDSREFKSLEK